MKKLNIFNKILVLITIILVVLFVVKIFTYKQWDRYYYTSSASNPEEFPVHVVGMWFNLPNGETEGGFYKSEDLMNAFVSDWGYGTANDAYDPVFLPESLFIEYIDFRTKNYYSDVIPLSKEKIENIFKEAKEKGKLGNPYRSDNLMEMEFHVGIANEGNIIIWLIGEDYEKELFRTKINPKPFPKKMEAWVDDERKPLNKNEFISFIFEDIEDSTKNRILQQDVRKVQYKDSIPIYFKHLEK